jgi:hypothetical protein
MLDELELESHVRTLITDIMVVMYEHGIREVHIGGMMRMLGIDNGTAAAHDDEVVVLTDEFAKYVKELKDTRRPDNEPLH